MNKAKKTATVLSALAISAAAVAVPVLWVGLKTVNYTVKSRKITGKIRVAAVSDFHSCHYGKNNIKLINAIIEQDPDIVIFPGDTIDDRVCPQKAFEFVRTLAEIYPCYYVTGNHEYYRDKGTEIKKIIASLGVTVLEGDTVRYEKDGAEIEICGLDDKYVGEEIWRSQLQALSPNREKFTLLLSHRPDLMPEYVKLGVDLAVSGHAHGGQLIIPGVLNGLYAPYQGLFPKYAGGIYTEGETSMIVSRGLMRESWPRIMNPPELVIIDLEGEEYK